MRYLKVLLLVLIFFLSMLFLFQNQEILARDMPLKLDLFFFPPMRPAPLPTYFILLAGFLLGALCAMALLVWDKLALSAKLMKARWRIRDLEKELAARAPEKALAAGVKGNAKAGLLSPATKRAEPKNDVIAPDPDGNA
jgi:ATP adenylyltransferase